MMEATHDATDMASTNVSPPKFLSASASEDDGEPTEPIDPSIDLDIDVAVGIDGDHYHAILLVADDIIVTACPHLDLEMTTLREAVEKQYTPCSVCQPVDWRADPEADQS